METITISVPTMLTIKEAAKTFKLSEYFLRRAVNEGQIVAIRAGKKILINAENNIFRAALMQVLPRYRISKVFIYLCYPL